MRLFNKALFKKEVEELETYNGNGTELISLYIPGNKRVSDIRAYLRSELGQVDNIKSSSTKKNVSSAITSILSSLSNIDETDKFGLVIFSGMLSNGSFVKTVMVPLEPNTLDSYKCDSVFYTAPLRDMCLDHNVYGLISIDLSESTIGTLQGTHIEEICSIDSLVLNKHSKGGQSAVRFERLRDISINEFFKKTADKITEIFINRDIKGILIGGPGMTKDDFIKSGHIHHELNKKIIGVVNTSYTGEYGIKELVNESLDILKDSEYEKERSALKDFWLKMNTDDKRISYGDSVEEMLIQKRVKDLFISCRVPFNDIKKMSSLGEESGATVYIISEDSEDGKCFSTFMKGAILWY